MSESLYSIKETADLLKVHWQTVRNHIKNQTLPAVKVGKVYRIKNSDIQKLLNDNLHKKDVVEVEVRYVTRDRVRIEKRLLELGAKVIGQGHLIDHWYVQNHIKNLEEKDISYDSGKTAAIRIRESDDGYTGRVRTTLEAKKLAHPPHHDSCIEAEMEIASFEEANAMLRMMNYKEMVTLDKDRLVYKMGEYKVVIDAIKDYLTAVEIEAITSESRKTTLVKLEYVASQLGLSDKDRTDKSVTYMAIREFAKY